ncbi:MAG: PD-(D/E)XK nuclease family protein [Chloroflexi bacterium]|nr:PD-(D/E)XK nuclease family protein [Chloroflexota bacterium]
MNALAGAIEAVRRGRTLEPVTVITPSVFSSFYLRRALASGGLFNVRFSRLDDLAEVLAPPVVGKPPLTRMIASEMVTAVLSDRSIALPEELERVRTHPSLAAAVHRTLDLLEGVPPRLLERLAAGGRIQAAVVILFQAYRKRAEAFEHRMDVAGRAAEMVRVEPDLVPTRLGGIVFLDVEPASRPYRRFADAIRALPGTRVLGDAQDWPDGMKLVSVPDPAAEVQWIVRNCIALAREGLRFGDIAVFYDDSAYGLRLEEALRLAGVPVSGPDPTRFADHPEGRFLLGALECLAMSTARGMELRRDAVMDWLTGSPVLPRGAEGSFHASRWDGVSRNAGVVRGIESWRTRLTAYAEQLERRASAAFELGEIDVPTQAAIRAEAGEARTLLSFIEELGSEFRPPADGTPWSEFADWARKLTERYLERGADGASADPVRDRTIWLIKLFDRLGQLDSVRSEGPPFERFAAVVREQLFRPTHSNRGLGLGVFVAPVGYAPGTSFDAVHVAGMIEGRFPSAPPDDALLPEETRLRIDPGGEWLENRATDRVRQTRRFQGAVRAGKKPYLLSPRAEAGAARRSWPAQWFIEAARRCSGDPALQASALLEAGRAGWLETVTSAYDAVTSQPANTCADEHEFDIRSIAEWRHRGGRVESHLLARESGGRLARGVSLMRARFSEEWTTFDGNLTSRSAAGGVPDEAISPTRLETWATCPFRYFLAYVLKVDSLPRPEEVFTIAPIDRGTLIHGILQEYFAGRQSAADPNARAEIIARIANPALESAPSRYVVGKAALWALAREEIESGLLEFVSREVEREQETGLRQVHAELRFGLRGAAASAVAIRLANGRDLAFRGVMDRAEVSPDGKRGAVIDYKTGSPDPYRKLEKDPIDRGKRLQLPVYADALRAFFPDLESLTAQYWFIGARGGFAMIPEAGINDSAAMRQAAGVIIDGINGGVYVARPGKRGELGFENCRFCEFDRVCPGARDRIWERKGNAPGVAAYRTLAEGNDGGAAEEAAGDPEGDANRPEERDSKP